MRTPNRPHLLGFRLAALSSPRPYPVSELCRVARLLFINRILLIRSAPTRCTRVYSVDPSRIKYASMFAARPALPNPLADSGPSLHPTRCCESNQLRSSEVSKSISGRLD